MGRFSMFGYRHRDPAIRTRARDHAAWLIRDHGDRAEEVLREKMSRPNLSKDDRYRFELTAKALAKRREQLRNEANGIDRQPSLLQRLRDLLPG